MDAQGIEASSRPAWASTVERGSAAALRLVIWMLRRVGRRATRLLLLRPTALYFMLTDRRARGASRAYFERLVSTPEGRRALGHAPGWRDTYRHLLEFSTSTFDRVCLWSAQAGHLRFLHQGAEHFAHLPAASRGQRNALGKCGALIVGSHAGTFDMLRSICMEADVAVNAVMYEGNSERITSFFQALDPRFDMRLIEPGVGATGAALKIRAAVERGEFVSIMGDRVGLDERQSLRVQFLGAPARFSEGPFRLAVVIGCPVMLATALRVGDATYRVESEPLFDGRQVPRAERAKVIQEMVEGYAAYLERVCARAPYQWFNFFDFWEQAPAALQEPRKRPQGRAQ